MGKNKSQAKTLKELRRKAEKPLKEQPGRLEDISAQELARSRAQFEAIFNSITDAVIFTDTSHRFLMGNPALESMFGYTCEELAGKTAEILYADRRDFERLREKVFSPEAESRHKIFEMRLRRKDGTAFSAEVLATKVRDHQGVIIGCLGIARDITERKEAEKALRDSEERYKLLFESSPLPMWVYDIETLRFLAVNNAAIRHYGYSREEFLSMTIKDIRPREDIPGLLKRLPRIYSGISLSGIWRHLKKGGTIIDVAITSHDITFDRKRARLVLAQDVTAQKRAERRVHEERDRAQRYLDIAGVMLVALDRNQRTVLINKKGCDILGYGESEILGKNWFDNFVPERMGDRAKAGFDKLMAGEIASVEYFESPVLTKHGEERIIAWNNALLTDESGKVTGTLSSGEDITERKKMEKTIQYQAYYDTLTGLPNRALFIDHLSLALAQAQRNRHQVAVIYVDLDRFKNVTDSLGHALGDRFLQEAANRLRLSAPEVITISRIGGDEYALLLSQVINEGETAKIAKRVLSNLRQPWLIDSHRVHITASIGISTYPNDGEEAEALLGSADVAMSQVKEQGGDGYQFYNKAMNLRVLERIKLENSLRLTLERGGFILYYQPQINIKNKQLTGVEALIRWKHPRLGLLEPVRFIQLAEDTGLIVPIGEWVLRAACEQVKEWQNAGLPHVCVSVNFSARQFQQPDLVEMVSQVLKETGLDSKCLDIEITESTAMQNIEATIPKLAELSSLGIQFAIDDFGTGYSSLGYLKKLPIQKLKIDKSFISDLAKDPDYKTIVQAVIVMAHNLKLKVVAEGVENEEQLAFLRSSKCDEMQGYLYSRPLLPGEFEKLLRKN
ncbi:MAG: EAL domain-containing protein [Nitrospirae bacterium]|nr:EAL domain-containing protein [Nitrospirota bacterium]